jgi:phasin family protein
MDMLTNEATDAVSKASAAFSTGVAQASAGLEKTQEHLKEHMGKAIKKAEEVATFSQGTFDALLKSGQIWTAGVQDLSKQIAATAQSQMEDTMSTFKALSGLRSLKEVMDLQTSFARSAVEKAMSETGRLTDASFRLAEQTMAPLTARVSVAVETFSKAV